MKDDVPNLKDFDARLRDEAHEDLADVIPAEAVKKTQIIAIYGKGGIGKSFTLANLSHISLVIKFQELASSLLQSCGALRIPSETPRFCAAAQQHLKGDADGLGYRCWHCALRGPRKGPL